MAGNVIQHRLLLVRVDPVQHRVREHGVHRLTQRKVQRVAGLELQLRVAFAGQRQHFCRGIHAGHIIAARGKLLSQRAVAAAQVHHAGTGRSIQQVHHGRAVLRHEHKIFFVLFSIPKDIHGAIAPFCTGYLGKASGAASVSAASGKRGVRPVFSIISSYRPLAASGE